MRSRSENKHILVKIVLAFIIFFLILMAFVDFTPIQNSVEKDIPNRVSTTISG